MNVSQAEFQNMKEEIVKDMIVRLMEERNLSLQDAFDVVYTSRLFEKLTSCRNAVIPPKESVPADIRRALHAKAMR